jgi:hypothetical protein
MNRFSSHQNHKIVLNTKDLRIRASPRHGGQGVFFEFLVTDPPHKEALFWGGGIHRT